MSWARWGRATASGEDYTHSAPARAQAQCQTYRRGNTRLCKGIYPRLARPHLSWRESPSLQRENILHKNLLELIQYIFIHWHRVWSPTQFTIVLPHTNQSFFINSDTSSFQWSFSLTSGCLAPCQGRAMMVMTFSPLGIHGGGGLWKPGGNHVTCRDTDSCRGKLPPLLHVHTGSKARHFNNGEITARHQAKRCRKLVRQFFSFNENIELKKAFGHTFMFKVQTTLILAWLYFLLKESKINVA